MTADQPTTIFDLLSANRDAYGAKPAILDGSGRTASHAEVADHADYVRNRLAESGVSQSDRIAVVLPPGIENALCLLGVMSGATAAPLNRSMKVGEFAFYLSDVRARALIVAHGKSKAARLAAADAGIPVVELTPCDPSASRVFSLDPLESLESRKEILAAPEPDDLALLLHTSGTTARPKLVGITHGSLIAKSGNTISGLRLGASDRCCNIMPLFHGHGIYDGLVAPLLGGGSTIQYELSHVPEFFETLNALAATWLTGGFGLHRMILENGAPYADLAKSAGLRLVRTGSGALDTETANRLHEFYGAEIVLTYATTETGTIAAARIDGMDSQPGLASCAPDGEIAILSEQGDRVPAEQDGEIAVKGPHVSAYVEDTATTSIGDWHRTGDFGRCDDQGGIRIVGRKKEIINRGGEKISPAEIDEILRLHPDVEAGAAFAVPHRTLGQEVAAAVVLKDGGRLDSAELKSFIGKHLASFKVPRQIFAVGSLPLTPTGKVKRAELARLNDIEPSESEKHEPQRSDLSRVERKLSRIWANELGLERVGPDDDFFMLGGDSLQAIHVFEEIEKAFNRKMPSSILFEAGTVREMARQIIESGLIEPVFAIRTDGSKPPLFIAPGGGGNVITFRHLTKYIEPDRPVYALQPMALWNESEAIFSTEKMATRYLEEILRISPSGPYFVAGYSFGGLVAHEIAAQMEAKGLNVGLLILIDSYLKKTAFEFGPREVAERHAASIKKIYRNPRKLAEFLYARLRNIFTYGGRWISVQKLKRSKKKAHSKGKQLPLSLRSVHSAQIIARQGFEPKNYSGPTVLIAAEDDSLRPPRSFDRWSEVVAQPFVIETTPGNHNTILKEPNAPIIARKIDDYLSKFSGA